MNRGLKYQAVTQDNHTIHLRTQRADSAAYSLYPNGWYSIDNFSRHIFIGGERIASVSGIHSGGLVEYDNQDLYTAGCNVGVTVGYDSLLAVQSSLITLYSDSLHAPFCGSPEAVRSVKYLGITGGLGMTRDSAGGENDSLADNRARADESRTASGDSVYYYHRDHLGSTMSVTDCNAHAVQTVEYTPWGEVFLEKRNGSFFYSPYLFNGKELDEETGLYYYGARYYDPKISVWYSTDPMQEKYPWVTTYGYCINNPIKLVDPNGEDWYQDEDGTMQFSPDVHSQRDLKGNQKYMFKELNHQKYGIYYRKDGSILYKNETAAYNRMWNQADVHYRKIGEKGGREVGAYILSNGNVLVMPDYFNDTSTTRFDVAGYELRGRKLFKNDKLCYYVVGQIHTHQNKSLPATPSFIIDGGYGGYGDLGVSLSHNSLPVFTIGHDGKIHGIRGYRDKQGSPIGLSVNLSTRESSRFNLLKGITSLYSIIGRLPKIKK